jgi:charged multivesicular body protein 6
MGNATSSRSSPKITPHDKAILQLKLQRDKLQKSKQKIQTVIRRENQLAKQCVIAKNFEKAKLTLRKKKRQQSLLDTLERQSNTLEELIDTIEFKLIEKDVLYGLEQGNKVLKEINGEMSIEKVDKIMEETAEAVEYQNELSERLGTLLTNSEELEVDEELRALELEMGVAMEEPIQKIPATSAGDAVVKDKLGNLPSAPSGIQKETNVEDEENETSAVRQENERVALPA